MKTGKFRSLAKFELSELYHRDVQSLNHLAQLNVNSYEIILRKKERNRWRNVFSSFGNPILMIFFKSQEINVHKQIFSDKN